MIISSCYRGEKLRHDFFQLRPIYGDYSLLSGVKKITVNQQKEDLLPNSSVIIHHDKQRLFKIQFPFKNNPNHGFSIINNYDIILSLVAEDNIELFIIENKIGHLYRLYEMFIDGELNEEIRELKNSSNDE